MSTTNINELDTLINNKLAILADDDKNGYVEVMALIDHRYHFNDTVVEFNTRLRNSVKNNFNKGFLRGNMEDSFSEWYSNLNNLPDNASRFEIFNAAPEQALHIVGL
jgi:hypothetical protein